jgi:hypothetical protein
MLRLTYLKLLIAIWLVRFPVISSGRIITGGFRFSLDGMKLRIALKLGTLFGWSESTDP